MKFISLCAAMCVHEITCMPKNPWRPEGSSPGLVLSFHVTEAIFPLFLLCVCTPRQLVSPLGTRH